MAEAADNNNNANKNDAAVVNVQYEFYESIISVTRSMISKNDVLIAAARAFPPYMKQLTVFERPVVECEAKVFKIPVDEHKTTFVIYAALETSSPHYGEGEAYFEMCQASMTALLNDIREYAKVKIGDAYEALKES